MANPLMAAMKSLQSPAAATQQAQNEAFVRFGPQRFALQQLLQQAVWTKQQALHAAAAAEQGIQRVISQARGETQQNYATATQSTADTRALVDQALQHLGAAAQPFQAAIAGERGATQDRLTLGQTGSLQDLTNQRLQAAAGHSYANEHALQQFGLDTQKIQQGYESLASQQGAFTQGRVAELKKEAADRMFQMDLATYNQGQQDRRSRIQARTQRRGQDLSHQDRQAAIEQRKQAAAQKRNANRIGPHGPKLQTQSAHTALWNAIQEALPDANKQKGLGRQYGETATLLANGRNQLSVTDPKNVDPTTGKPQKLTVPGIRGRGRLAAIVAADYAYYGGISQRTMNILHSQGFSTRQLRLKRATRNSAARGLNQAGQNAAQGIANALKG